MGLAPWGALGGGAFKTEEQRKTQEGRQVPATEAQITVTKVLDSVAKRKNTVLTSIALAYVLHKTPYVFPIVGGRKVDHLRDNIEALKIRLSSQDLRKIEEAVPFQLGFPYSFLYNDSIPKHPGHVGMLDMAGTFDYVQLPQPIEPYDI